MKERERERERERKENRRQRTQRAHAASAPATRCIVGARSYTSGAVAGQNASRSKRRVVSDASKRPSPLNSPPKRRRESSSSRVCMLPGHDALLPFPPPAHSTLAPLLSDAARPLSDSGPATATTSLHTHTSHSQSSLTVLATECATSAWKKKMSKKRIYEQTKE